MCLLVYLAIILNCKFVNIGILQLTVLSHLLGISKRLRDGCFHDFKSRENGVRKNTENGIGGSIKNKATCTCKTQIPPGHERNRKKKKKSLGY